MSWCFPSGMSPSACNTPEGVYLSLIHIYLRTLPIHESQRELPSEVAGVACFELEVCPTYDLYQALLAMGDQIEVLEPQSVREEMYNFAKNLMAYYEPTTEA